MVEPFDIGRSCGGEALLFKPGASWDFAIIRDPADAPLVAAAPVMLEACKVALSNAYERLERVPIFTPAGGGQSRADVQAEIRALQDAIATAEPNRI